MIRHSLSRLWVFGLLLAALTASRPLAAAGPALDPESDKFSQTVRLIMTKQETRIFERLPDAASRRQFIADFWLKRDPDPDTPANEFRRQFEDRIKLVNERFGNEGGLGTKTDRGQVFLLLGPPDRIEEKPSTAVVALLGGSTLSARMTDIWWYYEDPKMAAAFATEPGSHRYRISKVEGDLLEAMDLAKLGNDVRTTDVFTKRFVKFAAVYDPTAGELEVRLPVKALAFRENDEGKAQVDLRFLIDIYPDQGAGKESFADARSIVLTNQELSSLKTVSLRFPRILKPGTSTVDVIIMGRQGQKGKIRQMFEIKAPRK